MKYAEKTEVPSEKSRMEIEKTLTRYGATGFMYGWQEDKALIAFTMAGRSIRFLLPLPDKKAKAITHYRHSSGNMLPRSAKAAEGAWDQACRQRWRAMALCIKAKLEAVECGITTFEHEFLAHFLAGDGRTIGDHVIPQLNDTTSPPRLGLMG